VATVNGWDDATKLKLDQGVFRRKGPESISEETQSEAKAGLTERFDPARKGALHCRIASAE